MNAIREIGGKKHTGSTPPCLEGKGYGTEMEERWTESGGGEPQVYHFDHLPALALGWLRGSFGVALDVISRKAVPVPRGPASRASSKLPQAQYLRWYPKLRSARGKASSVSRRMSWCMPRLKSSVGC